MLISPDQASSHRPHTHSRDSSPFIKAQLTLPSPLDHRTHPLYGQRGLYVSMALLTKFLGKNHSFHRITSPTHILGTPLLSLRHNKLNPVRSTTGYTPNKDGQDSTANKISREKPLFSPHHRPTHILGTPPLSLRHNKLNPVRSTTGHTPNKGRTGFYISMA